MRPGAAAPRARSPASRRSRFRILRTVSFLLCFNLFSFAAYLLLHPRANQIPGEDDTQLGTLKPWPELPSQLPWVSAARRLPISSCEAYFGCGFDRRVERLSTQGGSFSRCYYSGTLKSSICEFGRLRMDPAKIKMSVGGEDLEKVMGREEEDELPKFEIGAFQIEGKGNAVDGEARLVDGLFLDMYLPQGGIETHTMRQLMESTMVVPQGSLVCDQWVDEPTLLITRFEYANLFHTYTDWYSAYVSSRVIAIPGRPHVIFIDGHCKTQLEETWTALFSSVRYAKNFTGSVCFRHAVLSPLGYETALFKGLTENFSCKGASAQSLRENPDYQRTARLHEFGEMMRASFNLLGKAAPAAKTADGFNVLFVRRENYLAHPRHSGKVQSRLSNEEEVFDAVDKWGKVPRKCRINVVNGLFAHMHMEEQIRAIQEASVVIGAHGAGLTHLIAATPDTAVLEIISSMYQRPHFRLISMWKGLKYRAINLPGSYADPQDVIGELDNIIGSFGC